MSILKFFPLLRANLWRRRIRTLLTFASVATAFLLFGLLMALRHAITGGIELTGADRLITMHKMSFIMSLPRSYVARIAAVDGVRAVTAASWFGGYYRDERATIVAQATDADTLFAVYPELDLPADQRRAWLQDATGMIVGEALANANKWKVGEVIPLHSNIYRKRDGSNVWDLRIDGIYRNTASGDTNALFFHYQYFNEPRAFDRDRVGWLVLRVTDPAQAPVVARRIDALFANSDSETKTSSERAFAQSFINQVGNIGAIIAIVVGAVFFTMLLVTANTMGQSIRERTPELAVMKTLGFRGGQILGLVLSESLLLTLLGSVAGMLMARVIAAVAHKALQQYLPLLGVPPAAWLAALAIAAGLGLLAGALPAWNAWRLRITDALRQGG
jgi:putative ABC transport system permease protein